MSPQPHNLHRLAATTTGESEWVCACGHHGTAPDADKALDAHRAHTDAATYLLRALADSINPARRRDWFANNHERTAP